MPANNHDPQESTEPRSRREFLTPPNLLDDSADDYIADLMAAWQNDAQPEALRQIAADVEATALIDCIRYALIRTSLNSAAANYVPELVSRAVEIDLWSTHRAMRLGSLVPDPWQRAKLYTLLLQTDKLSESELEQAQTSGLDAIFSMEEDDNSHFEYLKPLTPYLKGDVLKKALSKANEIIDPCDRVMSMQALMPYLDPETLAKTVEQALAIIPTIKTFFDEGAFDRMWTMTDLLPYLNDSARAQTVNQILDTYPQLRWDERRSDALAMLAPFLSRDQLKQAFELGSAIEDDADRTYALVVLADQMDKQSAADALNKFVDAAHSLRYTSYVASLTNGLASRIDARLREQLIEAIFPVLLSAQDEADRATAFMTLTKYFNADQIDQLHNLANQTINKVVQAMLFTALASYLKDKIRDQAMSQALHSALNNADSRLRLQLLASLAPNLNRQLISQALKADALPVKVDSNVSSTVEILTSRLKDEKQDSPTESSETKAAFSGDQIKTSIIAFLTAPENPYKQPDLEELANLASNLTSDLLADVLKSIPESMADDFHVRFMIALSIHESGEAREADHRQLLGLIVAIENENTRASPLAAFALYCVGSLIPQILDAACAMTDSWAREKVIVQLSPRLTPDLLPQALDCVLGILDESYRGNALAYLAPRLTDADLLRRYLDAVMVIDDYEDRHYWMIAGVAHHLSGELLDRGLSIARTIKEDAARLRTLIAFLPVIADQRPADHLALIREIRTLIVTLLRDSEHKSRADVLDLLATENLFAPPIVSESTITAIVEQILEVCVQWQWSQPH